MGSPNLSPKLDPIPQPNLTPQAVQTAQQMNQTPPDPQTYFGGKTGAIADIANKVLTGWMAGKYMGEQRAQQKAAQTIGTMKDAVDTAGQAYHSAVESGDQKRIDSAGKVLDQQWQEYNSAREQYVVPPDMGKGQKKSVGKKIEGGLKNMFSPEHPQLYMQAALNAAKQIDPKELYGPSKQEQLQGQLTDLQLQSAKMGVEKEKRDTEARDNYEKILLKPDDKLTAGDKKYRNTYEQLYLGRTKEQLFQDQILDKVTQNQPLNEFERTKAEQLGLVKPAVTSTTVHTVMGPGGKPQTQIIAIGPDGKMVGTPQTLPGSDYVPPDQAQIAGRVINSEVSAYARLLGKAHPEWDEQTRYSIALGQVAKNTPMDWAMKNQQQDVMNRALLKMLQSHTKTYKDADGNPVREYDDVGNALVSHFITSSDDGRYAWNASMGAPETHWFGPDTYGPYSKDQLTNYDKQSRVELRAILKEQNKGLTDAQIDQMMPPSGFDVNQKPGAQAGPQAGGMQAPPAAPGGNMKSYIVQTQSGPVQRDMTDDQADALRSQGIQISPALRNPKLAGLPQ